MKRSLALLFLLIAAVSFTLADFEAGRRAFEKGDYATALKEWMPLAEKGNSEAQRRIGGLYENGQGVVRSKAVALSWYRRAALRGNVKALAELGWICPHKLERAQLVLSAEGPLLRLADTGDAEAQGMVAPIWYQKYRLQFDAKGISPPLGQDGRPPDPQGLAEWEAQRRAAQGMWRRAAAHGDYDAHMMLAGVCARGLADSLLDSVAGCEEDLKWLFSAALRGDRGAQMFLGSFYANGQGVAQNYQLAVKWCRRAAEQGDHYSQQLLGDWYFEGKKDVARDYAEAIIWYRKAAEATYSDRGELQSGIRSAEKLAEIFSKDTRGLRSDAEADKWYRRAAEWGSVESQRHLGYSGRSAYWFRRAAAQGDAASQLELGRMFDSGVGVIQDYTQAYLWFNLAASTESHMSDSSGDFAAKGGEAEAAKLRDTVARVMTADQIAEAQALARRWAVTIEEPVPSFELDGPCLAGTVR